MVQPQASMFWQSAVKSGLLDAKKLEKCWESLPLEKRGDAEAVDRRLARQAVGVGFLTVWQAHQLLAGRYQGLRIDRYELQDVLGQGGMGRVYLARDTKLRRPVALKILSRERMHNPRALARFRREARVGAQLQHENLIRVYDEGDSQGVRFLVMEYIPGLTVGKMIAEQGRLPSALAAELARQVAQGLEHLHQKGLLHRDVNPMNILVDRDGTAKLTDLGLAIDPGDDEEGIVTRDGATVGTFDYISPEQARHSRQVDTRSDIYSLGCTLYHMIAGRVPFPAPSLPEKLFAHQQSEPERLSKLAPDVPEGLSAIVRRMMSKKPEDRFARPRDVARSLEPFASLTPKPTPSDDPTPPVAPVARTQVAATVSNGTLPTVSPSPRVPVSVLTPSDPELNVSSLMGDKVGATSPSKPVATVASTDPSDPFRIDLGPPEPLSVSVSNSSRTSDDDGRRTGLWIALGLLTVFLIGVGLVYQAGWLTAGKGTTGRRGDRANIAKNKTPKSDVVNAPAEPEPQSELLIQYDNGDTHVPRSLRDAIILTAGKSASNLAEQGTPEAGHRKSDPPLR